MGFGHGGQVLGYLWAWLRIGKPHRLVVGTMINAGFTELLLGLLAILLLVAAVIDVRTFTISNTLNLSIALLAPLYWLSIALPIWPNAAIQLAVGAGVFTLLAAAFYAGMMGGGDVKLAAALALWFTPASTLKFLVLMSLAGGVLTLVVVALHRMRGRSGRPEIPYGVAIAFGGLVILTQRFLNQFA
jgi:prepilin peptidase CpaA